MKVDKEIIPLLSKTLFWDVDVITIDPDKHAPYIVERVLSRGSMEDFKHVKAYYGKLKLKSIVKKLRYMDDRVLNFCSVYFGVPISDFRCYTLRQSNQAHWNY
jgi:hypothetical protein